MPSLSKELRIKLANQTVAARECAEQGALAALENLAVHEANARPHMSAEQKGLRNRLRARGRASGDVREANGTQRLYHLVGEAAYEHWHRLVFTRFLTENHLLRTDEANGFVTVTVAECDELASELGARNGFELACRFASQILPGVFRKDDPVLELRLAPNDEVALKALLDELPAEVFTADDSLGWTYQFWQAKKKDEVNASGKKIGADEISPVTQLFTEDYMVDFLLHNTLGAWWAGKKGPIHAASEVDARRSVALTGRDGMPALEWNYLRFVQDEETKTWRPAAGTFDGWPTHANGITMLDPCMGSGHFLVFALPIVARMRMEEEGLSAQTAVVSALRDNIHGLELDPRCTQIGAFNVALTAWKLAGFQQLPAPHIACSGLAPQAKLADWVKLAGDDERLKAGMTRLYELFEQAPVLGSLIDPRRGGGDLFDSTYDDLEPLLDKALADDKVDDTTHEMAVVAQGIATAARLLSTSFVLVATNVPYLARGKQNDELKKHLDRFHSASKQDLSTVFLERCLSFADGCGGAVVNVLPHYWLFLQTYKVFRKQLLTTRSLSLLCRLGANAFETITGEVVNVCLALVETNKPRTHHSFAAIDASVVNDSRSKATFISSSLLRCVQQDSQLQTPDHRITGETFVPSPLLSKVAEGLHGQGCFDVPCFVASFWEVDPNSGQWELQQTTADRSGHFQGCSGAFRWEEGNGLLRRLMDLKAAQGYSSGKWKAGVSAWGKQAIAISGMSALRYTRYLGRAFDENVSIVLPADETMLSAIWCYCESGEFEMEVRKVDQKFKVTCNTLVKVPFDIDRWKKIAEQKYPDGLPKPHSEDPSQWLFNGHPKGSEEPLHVAVARLLNYRWPRQTGSSFPDCPALEPDGLESFADKDGIVCLSPINNEQPASARLRQLLGAAVGSFDERSLIAATGSTKTNFEDWLRDEFFEQHCKLFHHRPFIWHIWDGRKDGFHALVNYHELDHANLQKLTYSYLGDWIRVQKEGVQADKPGAAERLGAAQALEQELKKIIDGEEPHDLFVRWKPISDQAIGWHPDLNDGVRLNIRPFLSVNDVGKKGAGILRWKPNVKWDKDRGKEPQRDKSDYPWFWCEEEPGTDPVGGKTFTGNRWNDVHLTVDRKRKAKG